MQPVDATAGAIASDRVKFLSKATSCQSSFQNANQHRRMVLWNQLLARIPNILPISEVEIITSDRLEKFILIE